ncbi:MAG: SPOR domain-containing protein [Helicobacteraceae bacterium]|jgi:cell division septation protein DedD|nr:SPOR domain-containing protein [Helicobacteraceae bacterium]
MADIIGSEDELNDILIKRDEGSGGKVRNALLASAAMLLVAVIAFLTFRVIDADKYNETQSVSAQTNALDADPIGAKQPTTMFESPQPVSNPEQVRSAIDEIIAKHREARQNELNATITAAQNAAAQNTAPTPPSAVPVPTPPSSVATTPPKTQTPPQPPKTPSATPAKETSAAPAKTEEKFYIQIESLAKAPRESYLKSLRDRGLNVLVREKTVNKVVVHRIYVGPYSTRDRALNALPNLRRDYSPEAFIVKE